MSEPPPGAPPTPAPKSRGAPGAEDAHSHAEHAATVPLDADATRGEHWRRLLGAPVTLSLATTGAIAAFVAGTAASGPGLGAIGALAVLALTVAISFAIANKRAAEDFFSSYAGRRRLTRIGDGQLPPVTALLRKGDRRYARQMMGGDLPGGVAGTLAHYTYEVETTDSDGDTQTQRFPFTVVVTAVNESAVHVTDLACERREGLGVLRMFDSTEDMFRSAKRLELESEALDRRYEIFFKPEQAENWLKQLYIPTFILWLAEQAPEGFAFELSAGALCVSVKKHRSSSAELDAICTAAAVVAERIRSESIE